MQSVRLGRSGLQVSRLALGTMTFGSELKEDQAVRVMDRAAALGIYFFDTADVYPIPISEGSYGRAEEIVGRWMRGKRDSFVLATKCLNQVGPGANDQGGSRKHIIEGCEKSLRRLQTDHIDIYYLMYLQFERLMAPLDEVLEALDRLVQAGKILYVGIANCDAWELALAMQLIAERRFARVTVLQNRYNLVHRTDERDILPLASAAGFGYVPYNPLGGGILTGTFKRDKGPSGRYDHPLYKERYWTDEVFAVVDAIEEVARTEGRTPAQVALAWILAQPAVSSVLTGALLPEHLDDSVKALETTLSDESLKKLEAASNDFR